MRSNRWSIYGGALGVLVLAFLISWWLGRGTITLDAIDWPLSRVIQEYERQGGITLCTNLDTTLPVTLYLDKAPVPEALEALGDATDSRSRLVYVLAPTRQEALQGRELVKNETVPEEWKWHRSRPLPMGMMLPTATAFDARREKWKVPETFPTVMQEFLDLARQGYEATFLTPKEWNPEVVLRAGQELTPAQLSAALVKASKAAVVETFALVRNNRGTAEGGPPPEWRSQGSAGPPAFDEAAMTYRMDQRLASLPAAEREAAKKEVETQRAFWKEVSALPPEERRQKMQERMSDPAQQEKMEERAAKRDERRTPEQRRDRYRDYTAKKQAKQK